MAAHNRAIEPNRWKGKVDARYKGAQDVGQVLPDKGCDGGSGLFDRDGLLPVGPAIPGIMDGMFHDGTPWGILS